MEFVIFKNPKLRYRSEEFGGIAKLGRKTFILGLSQYGFLRDMKKLIFYTKIKEIERKIVDGFLKEDILMKITLERAKELGLKE